MAIGNASIYMKDIIPATTIETDASEQDLPDPAKRLFCELCLETQCSCGGDSLTDVSTSEPANRNQESIALSFETSPKSNDQTLSDKQTPLLISCGLVCGIIPTSVRQALSQEIPAIVFNVLDGANAAKPRVD